MYHGFEKAINQPPTSYKNVKYPGYISNIYSEFLVLRLLKYRVFSTLSHKHRRAGPVGMDSYLHEVTVIGASSFRIWQRHLNFKPGGC